MLYTSYFANVDRLPREMVKISISRRPPRGWRGWSLKSLAPSESLLSEWHRMHDEDSYIERYEREVLRNKDVDLLIRNLRDKFGDADICFLCYEKTGFCHRHLVATWLRAFGYDCREWQS